MPKYQLLKEVPSFAERPQIFRLAPPIVNERTVLKLAQRFRLRGDRLAGSLQQDPRQMTYLEGSFEIVVYRASGGLRFHDTARWQVDDGSAHVTFDDALSVRMAQGLIEEFALVPLAECKLLRVARLNVGVVERRTGIAQERVIDVGVAFQRVVGGMPVSGPGGKVVVYIDHEGEPTGIDRLWRQITDVHRSDVELQSPEYAQHEVVRLWGEEGSGLITVDDIRLGYFEMGWDESQHYLQPAYFLALTLTETEGPFAGETVRRSEHMVPAAADPPELLVLPPPVIRPQPRRHEQYRK